MVHTRAINLFALTFQSVYLFVLVCTVKKIAHFTQFQGEYQSEYIKTFWYNSLWIFATSKRCRFLFKNSKEFNRVRIKRIAIAKCDPFFNYRDANVANSTKFAIPNFGRNISFLLFFFQVVTFSILSRHFLRITHSRNTIIPY